MQSVLLFFNERGVKPVLRYSGWRHFNAVPLQTSRQQQLTNKQTKITTTTKVLCFIFILPLYSNNHVEIKMQLTQFVFVVCEWAWCEAGFLYAGRRHFNRVPLQPKTKCCVCFYICAYFVQL